MLGPMSDQSWQYSHWLANVMPMNSLIHIKIWPAVPLCWIVLTTVFSRTNNLRLVRSVFYYFFILNQWQVDNGCSGSRVDNSTDSEFSGLSSLSHRSAFDNRMPVTVVIMSVCLGDQTFIPRYYGRILIWTWRWLQTWH